MTQIVRLDGVSLRYPLLGNAGASLRGMVADRLWKRSANARPTGFAALDNISLSAYDGDRIALIGANGAGKTTLLRVIGGIYAPDEGDVQITGSVIPLLGHFPGVNPDATGYENVRLAAYTMGVASNLIPAIIADVEDFTELGEFLEMPLKTYSAGMAAKLLFAIVTSFKAEVFALDEFSFATGDHFFKEKAQKRSLELMQRARVVFLASHDETMLRRVCNRAVLLDRGRIAATGALDEVLGSYHKSRG